MLEDSTVKSKWKKQLTASTEGFSEELLAVGRTQRNISLRYLESSSCDGVSLRLSASDKRPTASARLCWSSVHRQHRNNERRQLFNTSSFFTLLALKACNELVTESI